MKTFAGIIIALFLTCTLHAQQTQSWSRVTIYTDDAGLNQLSYAGIPVDHGEYKRGYSFTTDLSSSEIARVDELGFRYEVVIPDVQDYYRKRNEEAAAGIPNENRSAVNCTSTAPIPTPAGFTLGSMGGFFTLAEIYAHLDNMATLYPNIFKSRQMIDSSSTTFEGRPLYWVKISDNPNSDEAEPEMLYSAAHHAREPAGVSQLIMYMYYLLENYNTDPEIQYIVNNTELYFVPCVNPDGYVYNHTIAPSGGGMWRKNRVDNLDGEYGVDLNRNYSYNWGLDNTGSSPNTFDATYRGTSPASEEETQMMQLFCNAHEFKIALNYHTYSNLLICPWGYAPSTFTPDVNTFNSWGALLTKDNQYAFGTADQTVGYIVNGSSDDWMYGEQSSKPKIMAMTPEAGDQADGFWPAINRIEDICKLNIPMDLYAAKLLLAYAITTPNDGKYMSGPNGYVHYDIQRMGLDSPAVFTVNIVPLSSEITSVGSLRTYPGMSITQTISDSISYSVNPATPQGTLLTYVIETGNGTFTWRDTVVRMYGNPFIVYSTNGNSMSTWTNLGGWGTTTEYFNSPGTSITDSPFMSYSAGAYTDIVLAQPLNLGTAISAQLTFYTRFELETGYDYAQVEASSDNGVTWTPLCGKYTTSNNSLDGGDPVYTGFKQQWVKEVMSLDDYTGGSLLIRYSITSDFGVEYDGIYLDDIKIEVLDTSGSTVNEIQAPETAGQNIPNPAGGSTFIPVSSQQDGMIEIYNSLGDLVLTENYQQGTGGVTLNTELLAEGIYTYRFVSTKGAGAPKQMVIVH